MLNKKKRKFNKQNFKSNSKSFQQSDKINDLSNARADKIQVFM